jgi:hypothetical protein
MQLLIEIRSHKLFAWLLPLTRILSILAFQVVKITQVSYRYLAGSLFFFRLFICAYNVWVISPLYPLPPPSPLLPPRCSYNSEHTDHIQVLGFLPFPYPSCVWSSLSV